MAEPSGRDKLLAVLVTMLGLMVVLISLPGVVSSVTLTAGNAYLKDIGFGRGIDDQGLAAIVSSREKALTWSSQPKTSSDLALAKIIQGERLGPGAARETHLKEAAALLENSLTQNPVNPYVWLRLGYVRMLLEGPGPGVAEAIRVSFLTGPHELRILHMRLRIALASLEHFKPEDSMLIEHQIRFSWKKYQKETVRLAVAFGLEDFFLKAIEKTDPLAGEAFQRHIDSLPVNPS